jgi:flagellar motor protein MotB
MLQNYKFKKFNSILKTLQQKTDKKKQAEIKQIQETQNLVNQLQEILTTEQIKWFKNQNAITLYNTEVSKEFFKNIISFNKALKQVLQSLRLDIYFVKADLESAITMKAIQEILNDINSKDNDLSVPK